MAVKSPIFTDIVYNKNGRQISFLNLPFSPHTDAWGVIPIPIAVIKNGTGPSVLLMGGNHGDEYEGPIVLGRLVRGLDPQRVRGRLIVLPAANLPAVVAGRRVSAADGKNMNRTFPGDPRGTPTDQISHYIDSVLFAMCDAFMDLHSGGTSLDIVPSAMMQRPDDPVLRRKTLEAVLAFGAPLTVVMDTLGEPRTSAAAALKRGLIVVGSELGSAGAVSLEGLRICETGVYNVLEHLGVLAPPRGKKEGSPATRLMRILDGESYVYAPANGIYEPFHKLLTEVRKGEAAGCINFLDDPGREPERAYYQRSGLLFCRRAPGLAVRGNCVAVVLNPYEAD
ncbi:MAG: succinylglutamate desuccinylase/aspartoacylase family protein [Pseudomonadota bacterium]